MTRSIATDPSRPGRGKLPKLLACGVAAGALFVGLVLIQAFTRPGFDLVQHPLSLLAVGQGGWVQTANFVMSGLLILAFSLGVRRALRSGTGNLVGPILLAIYAGGMILAGIFPSDAENGFPIGAHRPPVLSEHAQLHGVAFMVSHIAVILAYLVFAVRFARLGSRGWAAYCVATAIAVPGLIMLGIGNEAVRGLAFFTTVLIALGWLAALAFKLSAASNRGAD